MSIAQNIRQQEDLILQSAVFKSVKPVNIQKMSSKVLLTYFTLDSITCC